MQTDPHNPDLQALIDNIREKIAADAVLVSEINEVRHQIVYSASNPHSPELGPTMMLEESICRHVVGMNFPLVIDDVQSHPLLRENPMVRSKAVGAYAGYPIRGAQDQVLAVSCGLWDRIHHWTDQEQALLSNAASEIPVMMVPIE